jgi:hypothetical protein
MQPNSLACTFRKSHSSRDLLYQQRLLYVIGSFRLTGNGLLRQTGNGTANIPPAAIRENLRFPAPARLRCDPAGLLAEEVRDRHLCKQNAAKPSRRWLSEMNRPTSGQSFSSETPVCLAHLACLRQVVRDQPRRLSLFQGSDLRCPGERTLREIAEGKARNLRMERPSLLRLAPLATVINSMPMRQHACQSAVREAAVRENPSQGGSGCTFFRNVRCAGVHCKSSSGTRDAR